MSSCNNPLRVKTNRTGKVPAQPFASMFLDAFGTVPPHKKEKQFSKVIRNLVSPLFLPKLRPELGSDILLAEQTLHSNHFGDEIHRIRHLFTCIVAG